MLTLGKGLVPEGEYGIPFGVADIKREGSDVTIVQQFEFRSVFF
jgi:pyruvate/2-oxoglutarate/acetoin dehydrogenase E1 component